MQTGYAGFVGDLSELLTAARQASVRVTNALMTATYWEVGRRIVKRLAPLAREQGMTMSELMVLWKADECGTRRVTALSEDIGVPPSTLTGMLDRLVDAGWSLTAAEDVQAMTLCLVRGVAVRALVDEAFARAGAILARRRAALDAGAALLLEKETLNAAELPFGREAQVSPATGFVNNPAAGDVPVPALAEVPR
mgnify:CR=1 FL=1